MIFDTSTWLTILGILFTIGFGVVTVVVLRPRDAKITFVYEQTIELFDAIGHSIDHLSVIYNGEAVKENLILLTGAFVNHGKFDIPPNSKPITMGLPKKYKWLDCQIISQSREVKAELEKKDNTAILMSTGQFHRGEYIKVQALVQVPKKDDLDKSKYHIPWFLKIIYGILRIPESDRYEGKGNARRFKDALGFTHRILNTKDIRGVDMPSKSSQKYLRATMAYLVIFAIMLISMAVVIYGKDAVDVSLIYGVYSLLTVVALIVSFCKFFMNKKLLKILESDEKT